MFSMNELFSKQLIFIAPFKKTCIGRRSHQEMVCAKVLNENPGKHFSISQSALDDVFCLYTSLESQARPDHRQAKCGECGGGGGGAQRRGGGGLSLQSVKVP